MRKNTLVTCKEVLAVMREMNDAGFTHYEIGRILGVDRTTVCYNLSGRRKTPPNRGNMDAVNILLAALDRAKADALHIAEVISEARKALLNQKTK